MNFRRARARERGEGLSARETERAGRPARPRARDPRSPRRRRGRRAAAPPARTSASARTRVVMASTLLQRCFIHTPLTPPPHDVSLFMLYLSARARGASPRFPVRRSRAGPLFYPYPCLWSTPRTDKPGPAFVFDAVKTPNQVNSIHKQHDTRKWETPL